MNCEKQVGSMISLFGVHTVYIHIYIYIQVLVTKLMLGYISIYCIDIILEGFICKMILSPDPIHDLKACIDLISFKGGR